MDNSIIIKGKMRVFIEAVQEFCDIQNLPMPKINFDGSDEGGGDELAHSHPESYKICISERQLKLQNSEGLRETAYHEMTHLIGLIQHGREFENVKNRLMHKGWKPPKGSGVHFISGDQINEENRRIREDPERLARINEDSDYVKFLEGRYPNNKDNIQEKHVEKLEEMPKIKEQIIKKKNSKQTKRKITDSNKKERETKSKIETNYKPMNKAEIEESRGKIFSDKDIEPKLVKNKCGMPLCPREQFSTCEFCHKAFCKLHINYLIATTEKELENLSKSEDQEKYEHYLTNYNMRNGHPCLYYTRKWNQTREVNKPYEQPTTSNNKEVNNQKENNRGVLSFLKGIFKNKNEEYCYKCSKKYDGSADRHRCKYCKKYYCSLDIDSKQELCVKCDERKKREQENEAVRRFYDQYKSSRKYRRGGAKATKDDWNYYR